MIDVVKIKDKKSKQKLLEEWVAQLIFPGKVGDFIQDTKGYNSPEDEHFKEFCFYTEDNKYTITAIDRKKDDGFLCCGVTCRKYRPGEGYHRGNDLRDGSFTKETWDTIVHAIVSYELVKLSKYKKPDQIPDINA